MSQLVSHSCMWVVQPPQLFKRVLLSVWGGGGWQLGVRGHVVVDPWQCGANTTSQVLNQIPLNLLHPRWLGSFMREGNWKRPSHKWHLALSCGVVSVTSSASLAVKTPSFDYHDFFKCLKCRGDARCHYRHIRVYFSVLCDAFASL